MVNALGRFPVPSDGGQNLSRVFVVRRENMDALKKLFAPVDMTVGKPWEDILLFTMPMQIGRAHV